MTERSETHTSLVRDLSSSYVPMELQRNLLSLAEGSPPCDTYPLPITLPEGASTTAEPLSSQLHKYPQPMPWVDQPPNWT